VDTCIWSKVIGRNVTASRKPGAAPLDCKGRNTASTTPINTTSLLENRGERPLKFPSRANLTTVGGDLIINNNDSLTDLDGLESLTTVGWILYINDNYSLTNLDGLANLTTVDGDLYIDSNDILCQGLVDDFIANVTVGGSTSSTGNDDSC